MYFRTFTGICNSIRLNGTGFVRYILNQRVLTCPAARVKKDDFLFFTGNGNMDSIRLPQFFKITPLRFAQGATPHYTLKYAFRNLSEFKDQIIRIGVDLTTRNNSWCQQGNYHDGYEKARAALLLWTGISRKGSNFFDKLSPLLRLNNFKVD